VVGSNAGDGNSKLTVTHPGTWRGKSPQDGCPGKRLRGTPPCDEGVAHASLRTRWRDSGAMPGSMEECVCVGGGATPVARGRRGQRHTHRMEAADMWPSHTAQVKVASPRCDGRARFRKARLEGGEGTPETRPGACRAAQRTRA
jgi:hypothetical protein